MKKLKTKKHVYDYCGECWKIVNLTKFPEWNHKTSTFSEYEWKCPKCGKLTWTQPIEGLFETIKIIRGDKKVSKRLEKEKDNEEYWNVSKYVSKYLKRRV